MFHIFSPNRLNNKTGINNNPPVIYNSNIIKSINNFF